MGTAHASRARTEGSRDGEKVWGGKQAQPQGRIWGHLPNKPSGSHLGLGYLGEAVLLIGNERVLHGVHREAVEGDLGPDVLLEAFDHGTVEPAGKAQDACPGLASPQHPRPHPAQDLSAPEDQVVRIDRLALPRAVEDAAVSHHGAADAAPGESVPVEEVPVGGGVEKPKGAAHHWNGAGWGRSAGKRCASDRVSTCVLKRATARTDKLVQEHIQEQHTRKLMLSSCRRGVYRWDGGTPASAASHRLSVTPHSPPPS